MEITPYDKMTPGEWQGLAQAVVKALSDGYGTRPFVMLDEEKRLLMQEYKLQPFGGAELELLRLYVQLHRTGKLGKECEMAIPATPSSACKRLGEMLQRAEACEHLVRAHMERNSSVVAQQPQEQPYERDDYVKADPEDWAQWEAMRAAHARGERYDPPDTWWGAEEFYRLRAAVETKRLKAAALRLLQAQEI